MSEDATQYDVRKLRKRSFQGWWLAFSDFVSPGRAVEARAVLHQIYTLTLPEVLIEHQPQKSLEVSFHDGLQYILSQFRSILSTLDMPSKRMAERDRLVEFVLCGYIGDHKNSDALIKIIHRLAADFEAEVVVSERTESARKSRLKKGVA
jgi:hypothetical protein